MSFKIERLGSSARGESMKGLTSHVLDTSKGCPARGVRIQLWKMPFKDSDFGTMLSQQFTNEEGRCLIIDSLVPGEYELRFDVGSYFKKNAEERSFLNIVPVRFYIEDPDLHYHIPLVVSPWAYSTYKGGAPKGGVK